MNYQQNTEQQIDPLELHALTITPPSTLDPAHTSELSMPATIRKDLGKQRVMLVNSPNETDNQLENANYSLFPHIGIVQLATRLRSQFRDDIDVHVIDGGITDIARIHERIRNYQPNMLGISVLTPTYGEGLKLAQTGKEVFSEVVLGNDHAIFFPREILKNQSSIDYVIVNDVAETPLAELLEASMGRRRFDDVCSLGYRKNGEIVINPQKKYDLSKSNTIPDLTLIEAELPRYSEKYFETHGHLHGKKVNVVTINNARGCENTLRCSYCSIADLRINTGDPKAFWTTVENYHEKYGINLFFEVYDSFTASPKYVTALLETMPDSVKAKIDDGQIEFMIYARALGLLKRDNVNRFRQLGVKRINIGLDSGDSKILAAQRKNKTSDETNLQALKLLGDAGISVHGSFMLGAVGETTETVQKTVNHVFDIVKMVQFSSIEVSRLYPLPNSPIWDMLVDYYRPKFYKNSQEIDSVLEFLNIHIAPEVHQALSEKYSGRDLYDRAELMGDWYQHFTHIEESYALEQIERVNEFIRRNRIQTGNNIG
jgi:radical SAM superfamily enzyme YgiQ (UPF0313 family)